MAVILTAQPNTPEQVKGTEIRLYSKRYCTWLARNTIGTMPSSQTNILLVQDNEYHAVIAT